MPFLPFVGGSVKVTMHAPRVASRWKECTAVKSLMFRRLAHTLRMCLKYIVVAVVENDSKYYYMKHEIAA